MTINVCFRGTDLVVEYDYEDAQLQTHEDPGFDETVEVTGIKSKGGDDLLEMFEATPVLWESITSNTLEAHRDRYADEY